MDPTYEQTGITAVRVEVPLAGHAGLDLILSPTESWETSAKMIQAKAGLGSFDITGSYTEYEALRPYWRFMTFVGAPVTHTIHRRIGGAVGGEILGVGIWGERLWDTRDQPIDFNEYLFGVNYTFDFQTYLMVEFYHNGVGADCANLHFNDYMSYLTGEFHSLMQDYVFLFAYQPISDLVSLGLFTIVNLNDDSMTINPQVERNAFENVNISLLDSHAIGNEDTEFGLQDWAWRLRLRAYY